MSTKPASPVKEFSAETMEKKVYNLVESFKEFLPIDNDRNRLAYGVIQYLLGDSDAPEVLLRSSKVKIEGIEYSELASKLSTGINSIK